MPETEKYLNRDGLDEYNSLLPHSSGEMQEYVDDWLDEHPEATTTVQDGAITEPKLADKSVSLRTLADDTVYMLKGMMITREISGEILTADDAYSAPPVALTVDGKSTQAGTPTPDNPVPIDSIEVLELPVTFAGKNQLDPSFLTRCGWTENNGTYRGIPKQLYQGLTNHILPVTCAPNTRYVFSWYQISSTNTTNTNAAAFRFVYSDGTKGAGRYTDLNHEFTSISDVGKTVVGLECSYVSNPTLVVEYVQLVPYSAWHGSITDNYEPYVAPIVANIPMQGHVLRSLPDGTHDTLALTYLRPSTREGWAWYDREMVQRMHEIRLNACTWLAYGISTFYTRGLNLPYTQGAVEVLCNIFKASASKNLGGLANAEINSIQVLGRNELGIRTADEYQDVAAFVASLNDSDVAVVKLATPVTTTLDPIELPFLPSPDVTVWSDPSTGLQMQYVRDSNIVIQRIEEAIADQ